MKILKLLKVKTNLPFMSFILKLPNTIFALKCGIYTHHNPRSNPLMTGFNLGCIDEIDTFKLKDVIILDGENHPLDKKMSSHDKNYFLAKKKYLNFLKNQEVLGEPFYDKIGQFKKFYIPISNKIFKKFRKKININSGFIWRPRLEKVNNSQNIKDNN